LKDIRVGCVKYLNARPLISGWLGEVEFDHPSALCQKLACGELDAALVSSVEYLRRPDYRIVDNLAIAARGPVYSVFLAHQCALEKIETVQLDPASQTSVALLRVLLAGKNLRPQIVPANDSSPNGTRAKLLIGDQAIRFRVEQGERFRYWDLGEEWLALTGSPFVFALWLIRPEVNDAFEIADNLRKLRDRNLARIDDLVAEQSEFSLEFCRKYFCEYLEFDFGESEKAGLKKFHRRCVAGGIDVACDLKFDLV